MWSLSPSFSSIKNSSEKTPLLLVEIWTIYNSEQNHNTPKASPPLLILLLSINFSVLLLLASNFLRCWEYFFREKNLPTSPNISKTWSLVPACCGTTPASSFSTIFVFNRSFFVRRSNSHGNVWFRTPPVINDNLLPSRSSRFVQHFRFAPHHPQNHFLIFVFSSKTSFRQLRNKTESESPLRWPPKRVKELLLFFHSSQKWKILFPTNFLKNNRSSKKTWFFFSTREEDILTPARKSLYKIDGYKFPHRCKIEISTSSLFSVLFVSCSEDNDGAQHLKKSLLYLVSSICDRQPFLFLVVAVVFFFKIVGTDLKISCPQKSKYIS